MYNLKLNDTLFRKSVQIEALQNKANYGDIRHAF
jgi:hypothetical protein